MAENETLDVKRSRRWRDFPNMIWDVISIGTPEEGLRVKVEKELYAIWRRLYKLQVPIAQLLSAAEGQNGEMDELVRRCRYGRDFAKLFRLEAGQGLDRQTIVENVNRAVLDSVLDQCGVQIIGRGKGHDFSQPAALFGRLRQSCSGCIRRIAQRISENPESAPRRPPVRKEVRRAQQTELLGTSLIRARSGGGQQ